MNFIYHIASAADWEQARKDGEYRTSTRGQKLADVGYIHASTAQQVALVANAIYRDDTDLLVLVINADRVESEIRYEHVPDSDDPFPHIYGPLSTRAVVKALPLERDASGCFTFTADQA